MAFFVPLIAAVGAGGGAAALGGSLLTALSVGSAALTGISGFQQASIQKQIARNNAAEAENAANAAAETAQREQLRSDREFRELIGQQQAAQSASGFSTTSRSSLGVIKNTGRVAGEAAADIIGQGAEQSRQLFIKAANFKGEAQAAKASALSSLFGGALNVGRAVAEDKKLSSLISDKAKKIRLF